MSSKVTDVFDGLFGPKTLCVIYFWKSQSMMMAVVIFDFKQEGEEDLDVLQGDRCF